MQKKCVRCGQTFEPRNPSFRLCQSCFSSQRGEASAQPSVPAGYLAGGYFNAKGVLNENCVMVWAEKVAEGLSQARPEIRKHQLRRFYGHIKSLERKLDMTGDYDTINSDLKMLIAHVTSAASTNPPKVPRLFEEFLRRNLALVHDINTFTGFLDHFQAVVGYSERYLKKE